jgi:peptidyl-prolyl cis-trans isomerase A (cyclophilin A)
LAHGFRLVKRDALVSFIPRVFGSNIGILPALGLLVGLSTAACVFTPPPPLPEELAEGADPAGGGGAPGAPGSGDPDGSSPTAVFAQGEPPAVGMTEDEMKAYAIAQGDPKGGVFTLDEAVGDLPPQGTLWAFLQLSTGPTLECELFEQQAPKTVANFVGLARGKRPFRDPAGDPETAAWITKPYYDGTWFHRAIEGFMIQGGDPLGTGQGGPGYVIADEFTPALGHDRAGRLSMANRGAGTGGAQFFITLGPTMHLDGVHTIFGQCTEDTIKAGEAIAATAGAGDRPEPEVKITKVTIERR